MRHLESYFQEHPVIAGVRNENELSRALRSDVIMLFLLDGDIFSIDEISRQAREHDKILLLHLDLIEGLAGDEKAVEYLARRELCDGIVSTKSRLIKAAGQQDLMAVQRLFLLDSAAIESGKKLIKNYNPDAVEILPGIAAPHFLENVSQSCPVIGGGLIRSRKEIDELIEQGVFAISTSKENLWYRPQEEKE